MGLIVVLVFLGVFAVIALLLIAGDSGASQKAKQVQAGSARPDRQPAQERSAQRHPLD
jgi:hypothetical protein